MIRVRVLGAILATFFVSGAYADQFGRKLTAAANPQPISNYAFSAGSLSPNNGGGSRVGGQAELGLVSPSSLTASTHPLMLTASSGQAAPSTAATAFGFSGVLDASSNDPLRWIDARWTIDSYLNKSTYASAYGLPTKSQLVAPVSTSALLTPSGGFYVAPRGMR